MIPGYFAYLSIIFSSIGISFYIVSIFKGETRPNIVTWFFWALAPLIGAFLQIKAGAGLSVVPVFMAGFICLPVLITAFIKKNAYWQITKFDILCGFFSLISIFLWIATKNTGLSILFAILADAFAAIPTLIKSWKFPKSELAIAYLPGVINNVIGLLVNKNWTFSTYSFGIYFILLNLTLIILISRKKFIS